MYTSITKSLNQDITAVTWCKGSVMNPYSKTLTTIQPNPASLWHLFGAKGFPNLVPDQETLTSVADPGGLGTWAPLAPFLRPQIIFWGPNCTFLHSNNRKIFKKILPRFARHTISILNWRILIKNIKKLFIFEAPDYILRPKLHLFTLK